MTIQYNNMAQRQLAGAFLSLWAVFGNDNVFLTNWESLFYATAISVHSGAQPTADTVVSSWSSYNSGNASFLVFYPSVYWRLPNYTLPTGTLLQLNAVGTQSPGNTGTAAWAIIWGPKAATNTLPTSGDMASGTIIHNRITVVPVTDTLGNGIVRFTSTSLVAATPVAPADGSFNIASFA